MPLNFLKNILDRATGKSHEREFLPAALEIIESPPSPTGLMVSRIIIAFFVITLAWVCIGSVDIIAVAKGKIIPTSRTKIIQPLETGVVHSIHVQDGQAVKAGDVLIEIDTTISGSERDRLQNEHMQAMLDVARLKASLELELPDAASAFVAPEGATDEQVALQKTMLANQMGEIHAKLNGIDHQIAEKQGNKNSVVATINKLKESIPYLQQRADALEGLFKQGYGSKLEYLTTAQDLTEHQKELQVQQEKLNEAQGALAGLHDQRHQAEDEYKQTHLKDLSEAEQKSSSLNQQWIQATQKYSLQTLTSPVDGTVQQLSIHTEGGVVTPAQVLMAIVPEGSKLEIEAMVSNRDIGFVYAGQDASIKVDTFNFTKYGLLHGKVQSVSQDAIVRDDPNDKSGPKKQTGYDNESSEPTGQELLYSARVTLDQTTMNIDGRKVNLSPGMAVTVEIKTGSRHIIEYLLSPLQRHRQEALREM